MNLYHFVQNQAINVVDFFGLREVVITVYYSFDRIELTDRIKDEVNRIVQDALKRYGERDNKDCLLHSISMAWVTSSSQPASRNSMRDGMSPPGPAIFP